MSAGAHGVAPTGRGGAFWSRPGRRVVIAAVAALLVAVAVTAGLLLSGGGGHAANSADSKYGGYPAWLPNTKLPPVNTVLQSTVSHPQLEAVEGNTIDVNMAGGEADITAVGPAFPAWVSAAAQGGHLTEGNPVPASFTVTLIARAGTVPLRASAFSILTAQGQLIHPALTGPGGKPAPAVLTAGQHLNLTLKTDLVEGDGSLRWAPSGPRVMAGWLYQLELD